MHFIFSDHFYGFPLCLCILQVWLDYICVCVWLIFFGQFGGNIKEILLVFHLFFCLCLSLQLFTCWTFPSCPVCLLCPFKTLSIFVALDSIFSAVFSFAHPCYFVIFLNFVIQTTYKMPGNLEILLLSILNTAFCKTIFLKLFMFPWHYYLCHNSSNIWVRWGSLPKYIDFTSRQVAFRLFLNSYDVLLMKIYSTLHIPACIIFNGVDFLFIIYICVWDLFKIIPRILLLFLFSFFLTEI